MKARVNDIELYYEIHGQGDWLVLAHELAHRSGSAPAPGSVGRGEGHEGKTMDRGAAPQPERRVAPQVARALPFKETEPDFPLSRLGLGGFTLGKKFGPEPGQVIHPS